MDYSILLIYFVPETMAYFLVLKWVKPMPVSWRLPLLLPLCKVLALALCVAGSVSSSNCQLRWHPLGGQDFTTLSLSQPPSHRIVLSFLRSRDNTLSSSASLLSFCRKFIESSNLGSSFTAAPAPSPPYWEQSLCLLGAVMYLWKGGKEGREWERGERKHKNAFAGRWGANANK